MGRANRDRQLRRRVGIEALESRQLLAGAVDNLGTEFWLAFQPNSKPTDGTGGLYQASKWLYFSGQTQATVTVEIPGISFSQSVTVVPGQVSSMYLPSDYLTPDGISNRGIHVTSNNEIAVYGISYQTVFSEGFLGLPVDALGTSYRVVSYTSMPDLGPDSQYAVVATQDQTTITITLSAAAGGTTSTLILNRGQVYEFRSEKDLTGTLITADRPVAAFSGNVHTQVPSGYSGENHLLEQLVPIERWGRQFITAPTAGRAMSGDVLRVLAAQDGTEVRINGVLTTTLNAGQFYEWVDITGQALDASKPVLLTQFGTGPGFNAMPGQFGNPFMAQVSPANGFQTQYTMKAPPEQQTASGLPFVFPYFGYQLFNVWAPTGTIIMLDGRKIPASSFTPIGTTGYSWAGVQVLPGDHHLTGSAPFGALLYAWGQQSGFHPTGGAYALTGGWGLQTDDVPPVVSSVSISAGATQRSTVKQLAVTFSEPVNLAADAITLKLSTGQSVPNTTISLTNPSADQKTYLLTFSGSGTVGGSLADGIYDLLISASGVQDLAGNPLTADYTQRFHRLFGDADGNRVVNALDYAKLKATYGRSSADPLFNNAFDCEANSVINALDLAQFRKRYGQSFSY